MIKNTHTASLLVQLKHMTQISCSWIESYKIQKNIILLEFKCQVIKLRNVLLLLVVENMWPVLASKVFCAFVCFSTSRLHGALGCRPPNLKLQHKPSSPYAQHFSIIVQIVIVNFRGKMLHKGVANVRGHVLYSVYYYTTN